MDTGRSQNRVGTYTYCTALQMEDSKPRVRLQDWATSSALGGSWLVQDLTWSAGVPTTPRCLNAHDCSTPFPSFSSDLCLSKLPLHLRMRVSLNVPTSRLSRPEITVPLGSIHAHSLVPRPGRLTVRIIERVRILKKGLSPDSPPLFDLSTRETVSAFL